MNETPFLTTEKIKSLPDDRLISIISTGEKINWNILFEGESQEDLDDYLLDLYSEKEIRNL